MSYRIRRVDANQSRIVQRLRSLGAKVLILSEVGKGCPDILIAHPLVKGWMCLAELKDGDKPPSKQALTPGQVEFFDEWPGNLVILRSVGDAQKLIIELLEGIGHAT